MKSRDLANKLLAVVLLFLLCCGQIFVNPVAGFSNLSTQSVAAKTFLFNELNQNQPTGESLYDALGISSYNAYLQNLSATQDLNEIVIAVVDSGLDNSHPVFGDRVLTDDAVNFSNGWTGTVIDDIFLKKWNSDENGHGTHVAGIIADGTLANVKILPIKIFSGRNNESSDKYAFENAIRYLCALKSGDKKISFINRDGIVTEDSCNPEGKKLNIVAVNLSLGTSGYNLRYQTNEYTSDKQAYQKVVDYLLHYQMLPIVAAGNIDSNEQNALNKDPNITYYSLPASCNGVLAVSAYDNTETEYTLASFSYYNNYISVAAPGVDIWSACSKNTAAWLSQELLNNGTILKAGEVYKVGDKSIKYENGIYYLRMSGTSMATPFVTACYALLLSDPSKSAATDYGLGSWDVTGDDKYYLGFAHKALLAAAATYGDVYSIGYNEELGYGVVNVGEFAVSNVSVLDAIAYEITPSKTYGSVSFTGDDTGSNVDWFQVCLILLICGILIWIFNVFRAYFNIRRNPDDQQSEQQPSLE